jgi:hypothetical protein
MCDEENISSPGKWIFGHISQILDLQISNEWDNNFCTNFFFQKNNLFRY